jgi:alpha-glucosidase
MDGYFQEFVRIGLYGKTPKFFDPGTMKFTKFLVLFLLCEASVCARNIVPGTVQSISSPDGAYVFDFYQSETSPHVRQLRYSLTFHGKPVILDSELGVDIENRTFESALGIPNDTCTHWGENLTFTGAERDTCDQTWTPVYGEHDRIRSNYHELILRFRKGEAPSLNKEGWDKSRSYAFNLVVRAYDQGLAFRYHFPEQSNGLFLHIVGERTQFVLPEGTLAYFEPWAQGPFSLLPLKNWTGESERPLVLKLKNGLSVALAEAQMVDYARMKFILDPKQPDALLAKLYGSVDVIPSYSTPWRVVMAGEQSTQLIENKELILNLNPDNQLKDVSWIKPGKVIRVIRLTQADAKKYVDFAAERNLQYIHLDAGWYGPEMKMSSSALRPGENRDLNMPELTAYAASKNIGVWLYVNQRALIQQLDSILPLYQKWGIKGIKFGFVQVGNQRWSTWLHEAVRKCAQYGIMVDIHDEYRPTGFSRTYPNLMTQEGVGGNEEMPDAEHNVMLAYTRFLAGPADYTICYYSPKIKNTHAHQLALSVVYYSPIQFLYWYDHPSQYKGEPEVEFFDKVPTVWNDSRVLNGEIGQYLTVARRSGKDWFVGAITNHEARTVSIPLNFLDKGKKYQLKLYQDDDAVQTATKVSVIEKTVTNKTILSLPLKASGGVALYLTIKP